MRASARRTIRWLSGGLERWRSGGFAQGSRLAQAKIAGGEKSGDLLDDGNKRVFSELHVHLLKTGGRCLGYWGVTGRCRPRVAEPSRVVVSSGPAFEAQQTSSCGQPAGRQLRNTKARYCYPPSEDLDLLRTKTEINSS